MASSGASSLREIVAGLGSHSGRCTIWGPPGYSLDLGDADARRPRRCCAELFGLMVSQVNRHLREPWARRSI